MIPTFVFRHCATFSQFFLSPKGPLSIFYLLNFGFKSTKPDESKDEGKGMIPTFVFRHCATFSQFFFVSKGSPFDFLPFKLWF